MILDCLEQANRYYKLHPQFKSAFEFLQKTDLKKLKTGRHLIKKNALFAIAERRPGKGKKAAKFEAHHKYIDIQVAVTGTDVIGWKPYHKCKRIEKKYSPENDIEFFSDNPNVWFNLNPKTFAIFFPEDAHAPLATKANLFKVIIKVAVS